jgi:hypothetical protein
MKAKRGFSREKAYKSRVEFMQHWGPVGCPRGIGVGFPLRIIVGMAVFVSLPSASVTVTEVLQETPGTNPSTFHISTTILKGRPAIIESAGLASCIEILDGLAVVSWASACKNSANSRLNTTRNLISEYFDIKQPPYTAIERYFISIVVNEIKKFFHFTKYNKKMPIFPWYYRENGHFNYELGRVRTFDSRLKGAKRFCKKSRF